MTQQQRNNMARLALLIRSVRCRKFDSTNPIASFDRNAVVWKCLSHSRQLIKSGRPIGVLIRAAVSSWSQFVPLTHESWLHYSVRLFGVHIPTADQEEERFEQLFNSHMPITPTAVASKLAFVALNPNKPMDLQQQIDWEDVHALADRYSLENRQACRN